MLPSLHLEGIALAVRAADLAHFKPALQGVFLAFANADDPARTTEPLFTCVTSRKQRAPAECCVSYGNRCQGAYICIAGYGANVAAILLVLFTW